MPDKTLTCCDCGKNFVFSESEQQFFAGKQDREGKPWGDPKRCKPCRQENKRNRPKQDGQRS